MGSVMQTNNMGFLPMVMTIDYELSWYYKVKLSHSEWQESNESEYSDSTSHAH